MGKHLSDETLAREMIAFLGIAGATKLLGWLTLAALAGVEHRSQLRDARIPFASRTTRWRLARDVELLREHLRGLGYELTPDELAERLSGVGLVPA